MFERLKRWLTESELFIATKPATHAVDAKVHNELMTSLFEKLANEREKNAEYEKYFSRSNTYFQ